MIQLNNPVSSIMTKTLTTVSPNQKLVDVKHIFQKNNFHHHIPVTENDKLVGIISLIDFMRAIGEASLDDNEQVYNRLCAKDIMSIHSYSKPETTTIKEIAQDLSKGDFHAIPITANGKLTGIVTTADIIRFFLNS